MSRAGDILGQVNESVPGVLAPTLKVINQLLEEGVVDSYAIGGSIALMYYCEAWKTDDLDIYCHIPQQTLLIDLGPIYKALQDKGYGPEGQGVGIEGVEVQFLPPHGELSVEALETAVSVVVEGIPTRVFQYEYALAMKANAGRPKDWGHLGTAVESAEPDMVKLQAILERFGLWRRWQRRMGSESDDL